MSDRVSYGRAKSRAYDGRWKQNSTIMPPKAQLVEVAIAALFSPMPAGKIRSQQRNTLAIPGTTLHDMAYFGEPSSRTSIVLVHCNTRKTVSGSSHARYSEQCASIEPLLPRSLTTLREKKRQKAAAAAISNASAAKASCFLFLARLTPAMTDAPVAEHKPRTQHRKTSPLSRTLPQNTASSR